MQARYANAGLWALYLCVFRRAYELTVLKVESIELVSGATNQNVIPPSTWVAVKDTNATPGYVTVKAVLNPDISEANLPANFVTWTGGEAVEGHQLQRRVSKGSSAHTQMIAGCGDSSATGDVWVMWADVTARHTGNKTVYEAGTDTGNDKEFPYFCPGTSLGATNRLGESPKYLGWIVEIKGDITPAGIHDVVSSGWDFYQTVTYIDFMDNTNAPYASATNEIDTDFNSETYQDRTPDPNDEIFALDGPGLLKDEDFIYAKTTDNFRVRIRWNGGNISDEAQWWTRQKAEKTGDNYTVIENGGGNGTTTIDNFY